MSVLIKGMEMPEMCADCKLYEADIYFCKPLEREIENPWADDGVELDCPLVPVPPHGDLIDRDKFRSTVFIGEQCLYSWDELEDAIDYAPTIIPAEEGE